MRPRSPTAHPGRILVTGVLVGTIILLVLPIVLTFVSSFAREWTGVLPTGFVTLSHWKYVLGIGGGVQDAADTSIGASLGFSLLLALGGVLINLVVGIPIAYAVARYEFWGRNWTSTFAVLPLAPGIILGVAFLRAYPELSATNFGLIVGYSLLKAPYMVMAVLGSFESMPLRQLEESARSLGASWTRTFLTVIIPNAKTGIISGSIVCWTLAAAEFNFSYIVFSRGTPPLALFLKGHISNSSFLTTAAALSVFFLLVAGVTVLLQILGGHRPLNRI
ncbi:ABC transporter permease subunit (plasmid) [Haloferax mediterranei ATCC 33500]|nr:ABC transporter permease subunit [Haloferax mediterranei]AFK21205.1 ABC-type transport system permease protein [Haloferax mediterranei ATCC 33500]AHZ24685.1 sulfate ABC transporter permease [Haloferax mediterranei ATCC 33500]MDX5990248.1 ABC transporter permease subunit [Haloferax mediterranei ATCC 33500]QCQ77072.1 ABC transporter permease subunit [Haloferax mediterranei ATCC 33500]